MLFRSDHSDGYGTEHEFLFGWNWFPAPTRDVRFNMQLIRVNRSPVSSTFGYYVGGLNGFVFSIGASILF